MQSIAKPFYAKFSVVPVPVAPRRVTAKLKFGSIIAHNSQGINMRHYRSMLSSVKVCLPGLLGAALSGVVSAAHAQSVGFGAGGTITVSAVPTLSETMLMTLALLVAVVAWRGLRNKNIGKPLAALLLAGALLIGGGSNPLMRSALAGLQPNSTINIDSGANATATVTGYGVDWTIQNTGTKSASVISVTASDAVDRPFIAPITGPRCVPGLVVAPTASCVVRVNTGQLGV